MRIFSLRFILLCVTCLIILYLGHNIYCILQQQTNSVESNSENRPALRRSMAPEPEVYSHQEEQDEGGKRWLSKAPVCSNREFLLTFMNLNETKQVNIFYSRGTSDDRISLASGAASSKLYQCCPHYGSGMTLYYKFYHDREWFKYPHRIDKQFLDKHENVLSIQTNDFQIE